MRRLVDIKPVLRPNTLEVKNEVIGAFHRYVRQQRADDKWQAGLYEGDPTHSGSPSFYEIMKPLVYTGTTSYHDNEEVLDAIDDLIEARSEGQKGVIIVGDQQTFDRMVKLKAFHGRRYKHLMPFNGEMHVEAHFCHAGWKLWYGKLITGLLELYAPEQGALKDDFTPKYWSYYDDFMMKICSAGVAYLCKHVPIQNLDYNTLFSDCSENYTMTIFLHFLLDFAVPYVEMRQVLRMQSSAETRKRVQVYYNLLLHMSRVEQCNKFLYSVLAVHGTWIYHNSIPSLRRIWDRMSTVSLRGIPSRNIPIDHLIEKVNNFAKRMVRGKPTQQRILTLIPALNILMPAEAAYLHLIGGLDDEDKRYYSGKQSRAPDIRRLVECLENIIGGSWQEMQVPRDDNGFRQGFPGREPSDPWTLISDKQADIDEYVDRIVDEMQWGEQHR